MIDVIIIGAGAAGLSAARVLSESGKSICILEARDRIGGRIHTIKGDGFSAPVEAGAEFIHGDLPLTKALMKEANVFYREGEGQSWNVNENQLSEGDLFHDDWDELMDRLQKLENDMSIADFLRTHFNVPKYYSLVDSVKRFVQGYDAADTEKVSAFALREEWRSENIEGFRPVGGYSQLIDFLLAETQKNGSVIKLSSGINLIRWQRDHVEVSTDLQEKFVARKVLITVPISILKKQTIQFDPPLPSHREALQQLEIGNVIKFLVEFKNPIWERKEASIFRQMPRLNFLFSDAFVPTWWTQKPDSIPLLTGWLAGPVIQTVQHDDQILLAKAFQSLSYLFDCSREELVKEVRAAKIINWANDPHALGAYAYKTLKSSSAIDIFLMPVESTLYFAGEAFHEGPEMGTVEAALASGKQAASRMLGHI